MVSTSRLGGGNATVTASAFQELTLIFRPGKENCSVSRLAKLANSTVLPILQMTPKPRLSEFVLRCGTRRSVVQIHSPDHSSFFAR